ncbi:MAG: aminoacyl-tRNA hydrolase [Xanthomonadaceae bacterium]|mgnify:FL=1|nr:aminoacyl-tRNA hydrolase [Xanthomonadaceae bacterium]
MLQVTPTIAISEVELEERFVCASGPGGQNVNKVASAVQLRFDVAASPSLPSAVKQRLIRLAGRRISANGVLLIEASRFRSQERNRDDARARLIALIASAATAPKPRRPTKPTRAAKLRRLQAKRRRSALKASRGRPVLDD